MIFHRQKMDPARLEWIEEKFPNAEIFLTTPDHIRLHGWYVKNGRPKKLSPQLPLLIYFGGNAEEVSHFLGDIDRFKGFALLLVNYRGYGLSEGKPSETHLCRDALLLYDEFSQRDDIDPSNIFVMGRSLGTGVAVYLAAKRPLKGVILVSPYDSISRIAQEIYPYVPVSLILKHPFAAISRAPAITTPLLALIGSADKVISPSHSKRLVESWGGKSSLTIIEGADHNSVSMRKQFWENIGRFLNASLLEGRQPP